MAVPAAVLTGFAAEFAADVRTGLSKPRKELPSKYLYDAVGSALFETITVLPEYGLTRADRRLLESLAPSLPRHFSSVAELGSGSGSKTRWVLDSLRPEHYYPIDVSAAALEQCGKELSGLAEVRPVLASYLHGMREVKLSRSDNGPLLVLFLGSTIGNFDPPYRDEFLTGLRELLDPGDGVLIGFDLVKPLDTMLLAYDDPAGVTAAFNKNLLGRINRELNGSFLLRHFVHEVRYDSREQRIEMHLRSLASQRVTIGAAEFSCYFDEGETIWTESSYKFRAEQIPEIAASTGFSCIRQWSDREWPFAESLWQV